MLILALEEAISTSSPSMLHFFHILEHNAPSGRQVSRSAEAARASPPVAASRSSEALFDTFTKKSEEK